MHLSIGLASERDKPKVGKTLACLYPGALQLSPWRLRPILSIPSPEMSVLCPYRSAPECRGEPFRELLLVRLAPDTPPDSLRIVFFHFSWRGERALTSPLTPCQWVDLQRFPALVLHNPSSNRYRQLLLPTPLVRGHGQSNTLLILISTPREFVPAIHGLFDLSDSFSIIHTGAPHSTHVCLYQVGPSPSSLPTDSPCPPLCHRTKGLDYSSSMSTSVMPSGTPFEALGPGSLRLSTACRGSPEGAAP